MRKEKEPAAALECEPEPEPVHVVLFWYGDGPLPPRRIDTGADGRAIHVSFVRYVEDQG